ncbi:TonB-dependent receptor domain-containing protein [Sandarakinorhabdus oryzae]|uniref:TonB-dependent receptor domain-containing protein n=1 Tax=Sandarakinorhabdus oryzae TaxID=2675220 RepID=UPI0012E2395E|nr:TonB-dependent receptor [Sandarakinorhabdus oryzae]
MMKPLHVLLSTTMLAALAAPAVAQTAPPAAPPAADEPPAEEPVEVSIPGGRGSEIVVIGKRIPNTVRLSREVVSVLSQADIARTGEGDIAGALKRVTGLSVVGGRYVYVRGLGERYSLALLNGLPIPSPDPLRRVVPLDLFPTSVLASSVVQKSYSANFPGEFGGGVINLTTRAVPKEPFFTVGGSIGGNTVTTGGLGYVYAGGRHDWTGFDDGTRSLPAGIRASQDGGKALAVGANYTLRQLQDITASLTNAETNVILRNDNIPVNWGANIAGGRAFDVGAARLGFVFAAGFTNDWQTKQGKQQLSGGAAVGPGGTLQLNPDQDFDFASTELRSVLNGLVSFGAEFGDHKIRFSNLYVNDTIKEARIQSGIDDINVGRDRLLQRNATAQFRRQLIDTQFVGEFKFDALTVDVRGTYANSKRLSPYERTNSYAFSAEFNDYVNDLRSPGQSSVVAFSRLNENVYGAGLDLGYKIRGGPFPIKLTAGYAYSNADRTSERFDYRYQSNAALPGAVTQQRPDYLLSDYNVYTYGIILNSISTVAPRYDAKLVVHAGYGQIEIEPTDGVQVVAGVRYESGRQNVTPVDVFNANPGSAFNAPTDINKNYWLPALTVTWNFAEDMQLRFAASKTIARPQFRELAPQPYFDTESDRLSFGNQFLTNSELINVEARYEWYFGKDERLSVGGFYKDIDQPIDAIAFVQGGTFQTTFANAPKARLYGAEIEVQKYFDLSGWGDLFATRHFFIAANYTWTDSSINVKAGDTTRFPLSGTTVPATDIFRDGNPLTGQSDHVANLQFGFQDDEGLSEQTILLNYASNRVAFRGPSGQPDLVEKPGLRLDVVIRQGFKLFGQEIEAKFEARNLTNTRYQEFQRLNASRIDTNSYALGRSFQGSLSVKF